MVYVAAPEDDIDQEIKEPTIMEPLLSDDEIDACWQRLNIGDKTESLNFRQFCFAMEDLGFRWTIDDAKSIFKKMDTDKSKDISYDEFKQAVNVDLPAFEKFWTFLIKPPHQEDEEQKEENPLTIDEMIELLRSTTSDWQQRVKAMHQLKTHIEHMGSEDFKDLMNDLCPAFEIQLSERRSVVIKEVCVCLVDIDKAQSQHFSRFTPSLFPALFKCVRMNVQVISKSGMMACANIVRNTQEDEELNVLRACVSGFEEPHSIVREVCFTYIGTIFEINDLQSQSDKFWELIFGSLQKGVNDSDSKARTQCYNAIKILKNKNEEKYNDWFETLVNAEKKRVQRALGIKKKRQRITRKKKKPKNKRLQEIGGALTPPETAAETPDHLLTPLSAEDKIERETLAESETRIRLDTEKRAASTPRNVNADTKEVETNDDNTTKREPQSPSIGAIEEIVVPLKHGHDLDKQESDDLSEVDWRKQSESGGVESEHGVLKKSHTPKVGDTYYFLNVLGYKQKAVVREKDGDRLTVEWLPNDRRYSHTGVDVRNVDEPSHITQDMLESSTRSMDYDEHTTTYCSCIIS